MGCESENERNHGLQTHHYVMQHCLQLENDGSTQ